MANRLYSSSLILTMILLVNACAHRVSLMKKPIDLTYAFDEDTIYWPTEEGFKHEKEFFGPTDHGYFYSAYSIKTAEHGGTHIDAPIHFNESGQTLDEIPLERLMGSGALIDVTSSCEHDRDYRVTIDDFKRWETTHNTSLDDKIILVKTGFGKYWPNRSLYLGTTKQGPSAIKDLHFPGLHPDAASWLVKERRIKAIGIDTPSIDFGQSTLFEVHRILFANNVPALENVAYLDRLPTIGFNVIAMPMKIKNGSGGPLRIIAIVN